MLSLLHYGIGIRFQSILNVPLNPRWLVPHSTAGTIRSSLAMDLLNHRNETQGVASQGSVFKASKNTINPKDQRQTGLDDKWGAKVRHLRTANRFMHANSFRLQNRSVYCETWCRFLCPLSRKHWPVSAYAHDIEIWGMHMYFVQHTKIKQLICSFIITVTTMIMTMTKTMITATTGLTTLPPPATMWLSCYWWGNISMMHYLTLS